MLQRVLGVRDETELDIPTFQRLVDQSVVESQHLEYKSALPGDTREDRREFQRDVVAVANGGGGILIYGIREDDNDAAAALTVVPLGPSVTRLRQLIGMIEPFLICKVLEVPLNEDPAVGIVVVEIDNWSRRPYAISDDARLGYYMRTGRNRVPLSEADVDRMYRDRFTSWERTGLRLADLEEAVRARVDDSLYPIAFVIGSPIQNHGRLFTPGRATLERIGHLSAPDPFGYHAATVIPTQIQPAFRRVDAFADHRRHVQQEYGGFEFHDDGSFVGLVPGTQIPREGRNPPPVSSPLS